MDAYISQAVRGLVKQNLSEAAVIADEGSSNMLMLLIWGNHYYNSKKHMKMSMGYLWIYLLFWSFLQQRA